MKTQTEKAPSSVAKPQTARNGAPHSGAEPSLRLVTPSIHTPWFVTFREEIRDLIRNKGKLPRVPRYPRRSEAHAGQPELGSLVIESLQQPWFQSLRQTLRTLGEEKKLPPLKVSSKPLPVKSIWGAYDNKRNSVLSSLGAHAVVVLLMFTVFSGPLIEESAGKSITLIVPVDISPYLSQLQFDNAPAGESGGGGGGGQNSPLPANKGRLPRFSMDQLAPPTPVIRNEDPELAVEPTVVVPPSTQTPQIDMSIFGDPLADVGPPSAGPGSGGGIGSGTGTGVGSGSGPGVGPGSGGGIGGGVFRVGGGVSAPQLIYKVEPEYSEEARKAKYQGTVVLAVEVWPDGQAHNVRVIRSLGLGLDEKAIEAVRQWRFRPGRRKGEPVKVAATIEVNFRLL